MPALKARAGHPQTTRVFQRISLSRLLVVSQIAISLLMLIAAGLFVRTLSNLHSVELGFTRENVLLFRLDARKAGHKYPEISAFYGDVRQTLQLHSGSAQRESVGPSGAPAVTVINEVFAEVNFGGRNPMGQRVPAYPDNLHTAHVRYPQPDQMVYAPRTLGDPLRYVNSVREWCGRRMRACRSPR